ncbi:hypothetical protein CCHL11_04529 [Colletotrichum chlorophyti]|uniref:Uncharacterized protein n=1 Tax=Colletotrichum chlorophyti TaxID=708187 RepID=A0A1Q8RR90_9PEZI|nr:hypothetical protein CCHL11_04529 [Colletotrichum chlorophyti]
MALSVDDSDDTQMNIDDGHSHLNPNPSTPGSAFGTPGPSTSTTKRQKDLFTTPSFTPKQLLEQARSRQERQAARDSRWVVRERANLSRTPVAPHAPRPSPGGIEKKRSKKWKTRVTDSRLSSELDRLLVGEGAPAASTEQPYALYRVQHPLRAVLHSLPGFTFDTELDSVKFRKHQRVLFGVETLMEEGGRDAAKEWLEGFLLLTFQTMAEVVAHHPPFKHIEDIPLGFVTVARDMETAISELPHEPSLRARRAMERRLCQSYDMTKLVEWTFKARKRFLSSAPKLVPGFGAFGQKNGDNASELEKSLWAAIDAQAKETMSTD